MKNFRAAILDMDGVVTQTAKLHARAWKQMFDEFLTQQKQQTGGEQAEFDQAEFDIEHDYRKFVDGKPRYDGVRSFLQSRGIDLPEGDADDPADMATVRGLGNRKNEIFLELLATGGVKVWDDAIEQVERWKRSGWKLAIFSSSRNCQRVQWQARSTSSRAVTPESRCGTRCCGSHFLPR